MVILYFPPYRKSLLTVKSVKWAVIFIFVALGFCNQIFRRDNSGWPLFIYLSFSFLGTTFWKLEALLIVCISPNQRVPISGITAQFLFIIIKIKHNVFCLIIKNNNILIFLSISLF